MAKREIQIHQVFVRKGKHAREFSRGELATLLNYVGIGLETAIKMTTVIKTELVQKYLEEERGNYFISSDELCKLIRDQIIAFEEQDYLDPTQKFPERYIFWRNFRNIKDPIIIPIGGPTGVGTSFIAKSLGTKFDHIINSSTLPYPYKVEHKLDILSTDYIRATERGFSDKHPLKEEIPELEISTYEVRKLYPNISHNDKRVIRVYKTQARAVQDGLIKIIEEAVKEKGNSIIAEGIHITPDFSEILKQRLSEELYPYVLQYHIDVDDETLLKRLYARQKSQRGIKKKYIGENFQYIIAIKQYLREQADEEAKKEKITILENPDIKGPEGYHLYPYIIDDPFERASRDIMYDMFERLKYSDRYNIRKSTISIER